MRDLSATRAFKDVDGGEDELMNQDIVVCGERGGSVSGGGDDRRGYKVKAGIKFAE